MQNITVAKNSDKINPSRWKSSQPAKEIDLLFTADEVMSAWHDGRKYETELIQKLFKENINKAFAITENLVAKIEKDLSIKIIGTHLNPQSPTEFKTLLLVDKADFLSAKMMEAYTLKNKTEDENQSPLFSISFSFYSHSENIKKENIISDGYLFEYLPKG